MPVIHFTRHRIALLATAFAWAVVLGFVAPWLISAQSTLAVLLGIALIFALLAFTVYVLPSPSNKDPVE